MTDRQDRDGDGQMRRAVWASLVGVAGGGGGFFLLGLYLNTATGFSALDHPGPLAVLAVVGATIGGLVAPLVATFRRRKRG